MHILTTRGVLEQGACLDALISIMVDSSANQMVHSFHLLNICLLAFAIIIIVFWGQMRILYWLSNYLFITRSSFVHFLSNAGNCQCFSIITLC